MHFSDLSRMEPINEIKFLLVLTFSSLTHAVVSTCSRVVTSKPHAGYSIMSNHAEEFKFLLVFHSYTSSVVTFESHAANSKPQPFVQKQSKLDPGHSVQKLRESVK